MVSCKHEGRAPDMWHGCQRQLLGTPLTRRVVCDLPEGHDGKHSGVLYPGVRVAWGRR